MNVPPLNLFSPADWNRTILDQVQNEDNLIVQRLSWLIGGTIVSFYRVCCCYPYWDFASLQRKLRNFAWLEFPQSIAAANVDRPFVCLHRTNDQLSLSHFDG
jgi:hypothetical protein